MNIDGHLGNVLAVMELAESQTPQYDAHRLDAAVQGPTQLVTVASFEVRPRKVRYGAMFCGLLSQPSADRTANSVHSAAENWLG